MWKIIADATGVSSFPTVFPEENSQGNRIANWAPLLERLWQIDIEFSISLDSFYWVLLLCHQQVTWDAKIGAWENISRKRIGKQEYSPANQFSSTWIPISSNHLSGRVFPGQILFFKKKKSIGRFFLFTANSSPQATDLFIFIKQDCMEPLRDSCDLLSHPKRGWGQACNNLSVKAPLTWLTHSNTDLLTLSIQKW